MDEPTGTEQVDDPRVKNLTRFLTRARLRNGTDCNLAEPVAELLAEAVVHFQDGETWGPKGWMPVGEVAVGPDARDVIVEHIADGQVVKLTHRPTSITALGETAPEAWDELNRKVEDHATE